MKKFNNGVGPTTLGSEQWRDASKELHIFSFAGFDAQGVTVVKSRLSTVLLPTPQDADSFAAMARDDEFRQQSELGLAQIRDGNVVSLNELKRRSGGI